MSQLNWESGKGILFKNVAGGETAIINPDGKLNTDLLPSIKFEHIDYENVVGKKINDYLKSQSSGYYLIDDDTINGDNGEVKADCGIYLVFDNGLVLNLGNNFLE